MTRRPDNRPGAPDGPPADPGDVAGQWRTGLTEGERNPLAVTGPPFVGSAFVVAALSIVGIGVLAVLAACVARVVRPVIAWGFGL